MWTIDKEFGFDYGHRVWTQKLNTEFSIDDACVCRHLHGHRGKVHVYLEASNLDPQGMVTDFKHLGWLKAFLDDAVDHKFLIHREDPLYNKIVGDELPLESIEINGVEVAQSICLTETDIAPGTPDYEYYEGLVIVDFIPTSEYLSKWLYEVVDAKMKHAFPDVKISRVDWWETPKSKSTYIPD